MKRLEGKTALITGASRGIGRAIADLFAQEGARVFVCDIEAPTQPLHVGQTFQMLDVSDSSAWKQLAEQFTRNGIHVDILINNAGIVSYASVTDADPADWKRIMAVNLDGVLFGMQAFIPGMCEKGGGSIVNLSSIWGSVAVPGAAAYHASKGAVRNLTKNAAMTYVARGVRVNSVHPGIIATPHVVDVQDPSISAEVVARTPMKRMADPLELAYGVLYLASDEAGFVTGTELYIDGGYTAQ
ncbi:Cyclopentanol dehydrogenase [compost metagenome]